jgi:hypothetical protein
MVFSLWLPILLCTVVLFFVSFLSWVVLPFHRKDWVKLPDEESFLEGVRKSNPPLGSYMFPGCADPNEQNSPEYQKRFAENPRGVVTFLPVPNMGRNLGLTVLFFFVTSFTLGYLGTIGLPAGSDFLKVFRFFATAGLLTYLSSMVCHSIWFQNRIVGHVLESIMYALLTGVIFAFFWPKA